MQLKDKVVVITGGTKGFGRALAELFKQEGANVIICSHRKTVGTIAEEMGVLGVKADVRQEDDMTTLAQFTINKFGCIDIWINNAGVWMQGLVEDADMKDVRKMFDINVLGAINGSRVALREMKEKKKSGVIINIISRAGLDARSGISLYASTKWALHGFTRSIREENKGSNISILSVFPGGMKTDIFGENKPANYDDFMDVNLVAKKVIKNLKSEKPEEELIIKREDA